MNDSDFIPLSYVVYLSLVQGEFGTKLNSSLASLLFGVTGVNRSRNHT